MYIYYNKDRRVCVYIYIYIYLYIVISMGEN